MHDYKLQNKCCEVREMIAFTRMYNRRTRPSIGIRNSWSELMAFELSSKASVGYTMQWLVGDKGAVWAGALWWERRRHVEETDSAGVAGVQRASQGVEKDQRRRQLGTR